MEIKLKQADVNALARDLRDMARESRAYHAEIRQLAWKCANPHSPGSWPFWRHGFASRFGRRVDIRGYTGIPNYDGIAQQVAWHYPEYATEDGIDRLFELLMSPYDRLPSHDELIEQAKAMLEERKCDACPF